jgi:hypothetical protein
MPIFTCARARPMVRTNSAMRCFCAAKTCSMPERIRARAALALACCSESPRRGGSAELDPLRQAAPLQHFQIALGAVGGVGPDAAGGVLGIEQNWKAAAVVLSGIGDRPAADQSMPPVDADMALVAEDRHGDLDGLALRTL